MKDRLPILIIAVAAVVVVIIGVRMRLNLSPPPAPPAPPRAHEEASPKRDYSARVEERLSMLRSDYQRRPPSAGRGESENSAPPPAPRTDDAADSPPPPPRRGAVDLPVRNAAIGGSVAELRHTITSHPSREKRIEAAQELAASDESDAVSALVEALGDRDPDVRIAVIEALQEYVEDLTPDMVQPVLKDNNANVRFEAVTLLGLIGGPDAMAAAADLQDDPDPDVRDLAEEVQRVLATDPTPFPEVTPPRWRPPHRAGH